MTKKLLVLREFLIFILFIALSLVLALNKNASSTVTEGILLWGATVLPALFPYFFITAVLSSLRITSRLSLRLSPLTLRTFNVGGHVGYALFISLLSGYPIGAKTVSDLKQKGLLSDAESVRASALCSTSSPMFMVGSVGNITFNSTLFGLLLFVSHLLSSICVGIIFSFYKRKEKPSAPSKLIYEQKNVDNILYESTFSAVISVLVVGGIITLFYTLTEIFNTLGILSPFINLIDKITGNRNLAEGIVFGLFECTRGLKSLSNGGISPVALPTAAAICGFGGLSVIVQSVAYLKKAKIKTAPFFLAKVLYAVLGFLFGIIFSVIFLF